VSEAIVVSQEEERPSLADAEKFALFLEPVIAKSDAITLHVTKDGEFWRCYLESKSGKHSSASLYELDMRNDVEGLADSIKQLRPGDSFYNRGIVVSFVVLLAVLVSMMFGNVILGAFSLPVILGTLAILVAFTIEKLRTKFI
jgi:hypothetical protein